VKHLVDDILYKHNGHTSVGLIGMQWQMQVLTDIGHPEVAYQIATRSDRPSWGYMVAKGGTTSWERWDTDTQDGGMNGESQKILSGNLEAWCYQTLGGINYDPERPGFKHIILQPRPVGDLKWVRASIPLRPDRQPMDPAESKVFMERICAPEHDRDGLCACRGQGVRQSRWTPSLDCSWNQLPAHGTGFGGL
jgi:hypothetical protein